MSANTQVFKRFLVAVTSLAVGLIVSTLLIAPLPAQAQSISKDEDSIQRGIDASAARWQAQGETYLAGMAERAAAASSARYAALAETYRVSPVSLAASNDASAARWQAQGEAYLAERVERAAAASSARYAALAETYRASIAEANTSVQP
jgi:hypothetical protein